MDARARVHSWMQLFHTTLDKTATGRFTPRAREEAGTQQDLCVGGAILSLDLKQAFDRVNREALAAFLKRLGAPSDLIAAVVALHDSSAYHIQDDYHDSEIITTQGKRQGCKLAPLVGSHLHYYTSSAQGPPLWASKGKAPLSLTTPCANGSLNAKPMCISSLNS